MKGYRKAEKATKARIAELGTSTILDGIVNNDLSFDSLLTNLLQSGKKKLKNSKRAKADLVKVIIHKLGF